MDRYLDLIYESPYTQGILNIVKIPFDYLKDTLSQQSYENIVQIVTPVLNVVMILLVIQIIYSVLHFFYALVTRGRFKIKVLVSVLISFIILISLFMAYRYITGE